MIVKAIGQLGARLLESSRVRDNAGAGRARKYTSIRATHTAAYLDAISDEPDADDSSPTSVAIPTEALPEEIVEAGDAAGDPSGSVSRQIRTLADAEDAYASN
jgi:hypothetical protein